MIDLILKWLVPFLCGAVAAGLLSCWHSLRALKNGMQSMLRAEIIRDYKEYTEKRYCPIYAREALERAYKAYHTLGGNDVATRLYTETMRLPTQPEKEDPDERYTGY